MAKDSFIPDPDSFTPDKDDPTPSLLSETLAQWRAAAQGLGRLATSLSNPSAVPSAIGAGIGFPDARPSTDPGLISILARGAWDPFSKFINEDIPSDVEALGRLAARLIGGDPQRAKELAEAGHGGASMAALFALPAAGAAFGWLPSLGRAGRRTGRALQGEGGFAGELTEGYRPQTPPFYSQLQSVVETRIPARTTVEQVRATITNPTAGIKPDELAWSGVDDWLATKPAGSRVTREEVLGAVRETRLEDVVLGNRSDLAAIDQEIARLNLTKPSFYDVSDEASHWSREFDDLMIKRNELARTAEPKFTSYVEPGSEPGSYREMFVTAPNRKSPGLTGAEMKEREWLGNLDYSRPRTPVEDARLRQLNRDYDDAPAWSDGHEAYSSIPNPIVRIRFNSRTDADGKRVLFIEELQPPQPDQFAHMPEWAQKRWADIGLKRAVRHAAENGYDRVAWTKGEVQVARYPGMENPEGLKRLYDESIPRKAKEISKRFGGDGRVSETAFGKRRRPDEAIKARIDEIEPRYQEIRRAYDLADAQRDHRRAMDLTEESIPLGRELDALNAELKSTEHLTFAHSIDITPDLRRVSLTKGFPLFSAPLAMTGAATAAGATLFGLRELQAGPPSQRKKPK